MKPTYRNLRKAIRTLEHAKTQHARSHSSVCIPSVPIWNDEARAKDFWDARAILVDLANTLRVDAAEARTREFLARQEANLQTYTDPSRDSFVASGERNDCTVRALSVACQVPYAIAHDYLEARGRVKGDGFNIGDWLDGVTQRALSAPILDSKVTRVYAARREWRHDTGWRNVTATLHATLKAYKKGRYIAITATHALAIVDGKVVDTFLQGARTQVYRVYRVEGAL